MHQMNRRFSSALITGVAALVLSAPAHAQTQVATATSKATSGLNYQGTDANNDVRFTLAGNTITVDDIVPIQAGEGCTPVPGDATNVTCVAFKQGTRLKQLFVDVRKGDDVVRNQTSSGTIEGAPMLAIGNQGNDTLIGDLRAKDTLIGATGNDVLRSRGGFQERLEGNQGDDMLIGGAGGDTLLGGDNDDFLDGAGGDDTLDGGFGKDFIDGGPDGGAGGLHDRVVYDRSSPVTVDLNRTDPSQGAANEHDHIFDVEDINGGSGADTLTGNAENNLITGGAGNDILIGEAGADRLIGDVGSDILFPSPSDGFLGVVPDGAPDTMICDTAGFGQSSPGDIAFRVLADGDQANGECETVSDDQ